ncbi:hypothetical protein MAC_03762 [Metarhizium acridum CQMa 102]|uniref:Uncharacterized protein n=1 Tax=Metarhizium acridum (strain CQMa 102) TaxID=655827 RepID=E9E1L4_METAQ|nr:uncharacterized protein MAC_03762 [Metarhizium acridum CQMa 102]EFY90247.1 hypothetical protein MAC_03762 [Metarhizium acridum CQMa 102]
MPIRNPFARRTGTATAHDENLHPERENPHLGFERVDTVGSKASSALSIRSTRSHDTGEYKMSARSPVISHDGLGRQSLDSARFRRLPRAAIDRKFEREPPTAEEGFEDVGLDDYKQQPRKRGFFSKLTESQDSNGQPTVSRFLMPGRKRGQSGQGSELGTMDFPKVSDETRN